MSGLMNQESQKALLSKLMYTQMKINIIRQKQPLIFLEILKVFNINESRQNNEGLNKLKQRFVNICLQEKQQYLEYLLLPKFRQISQHALELLKQSLEEIFHFINIFLQQLKFDKTISLINRYIPKITSLEQIQQYHLHILDLYSSSNLCPIGIQMMENDRKQNFNIKKQYGHVRTQYPEIYNYSNFVKHQSEESLYENYYGNKGIIVEGDKRLENCQIENEENKRNYQMNKKFSKEGDGWNNQAITTRSGLQYAQENAFMQLKSIKSNQKLNKQVSTKNTSKTQKRQSSQFIQDYSPSIIIKKQTNLQNSRLIDDYSQPISNISQHKAKLTPIIDPNFKNCLCKGAIKKIQSNEFFCNSCMLKYHHQCLKVQKHVSLASKYKCPICEVQEINNFCFQLVRKPLVKQWIVYRKQGPAPRLKFSQNLLKMMKKIIDDKENNKLYLKLITINKALVQKNGQNKINSTTSPSKIRKTEEVQMESQQQNQESIEENQQNSKQRQAQQKPPTKDHKALSDQQKLIQNANKHHLKTSVQFTSKMIEQLSKLKDPQISLKIGISSSNTQNQSIVSEQIIMYYGIYEVKLRSYEEIVQSLVLNRSQDSEQKSEQLIKRMISDKFLHQMSTVKDNTLPSNHHEINLIFKYKFLNTLTNRSKNSTIFNELIPIRFSKCSNIQHVTQLRDYLSTYLEYDYKEDKFFVANKSSLYYFSPDTHLKCFQCMKEQQQQDQQNVKSNKNNNKHEQNNQKQQNYVYIDWKLYNFLNDQKIQSLDSNNKPQNDENIMDEQLNDQDENGNNDNVNNRDQKTIQIGLSLALTFEDCKFEEKNMNSQEQGSLNKRTKKIEYEYYAIRQYKQQIIDKEFHNNGEKYQDKCQKDAQLNDNKNQNAEKLINSEDNHIARINLQPVDKQQKIPEQNLHPKKPNNPIQQQK